jgi:chitinase
MMLNKIWTSAAALKLSGELTACTVGQAVEVPSREVAIRVESALEAQNMAMAGMMAGSVTWDETQFSSLLALSSSVNRLPNNPKNITAGLSQMQSICKWIL